MSGSTSGGTSVGSVADMVSRIRTVIPSAWFPLTAPDATTSATPVLDGLLNGIGEAWSFCYALTLFVRQQTRIATATGGFLDMICADLFGAVIKRNTAEADVAFRSRIQANLLLPRATRGALQQTLLTLLGKTPLIFEPARAADTGGYGGSLVPAAGGGGGYGSPALTLGSASMPFQFLVAIPGATGWTRRESQASYLDGGKLMQIASRHVLRPAFTDGIVTGSLIEARGLNLIKDSIGWVGWSPPISSEPVTWSIDPSGQGALLAAQPVLRLTIDGTGSFVGPAVTLPLVAGSVTASLWVMVPSAPQLQSLELALVDETGTGQVPIDLTETNVWQRVSVATFAPATFIRPVTMQLVGQALAAMTNPVLTQCWQIEPGSEATSYIPSGGQIGIREADDDVVQPVQGGSYIDQYSLNEAIRRVIPVGSTAWTTLVA